MSLFQPDLTAMGIPPRGSSGPNSYGGWSNPVTIVTANGTVNRESLTVELQLRKPDTTPASDWFRESAVLVQQGNYLTGGRIRRHFYFATAPGNRHLFVAQKKNGLMSILPAV
jgi:hypothetical protein